MSVHLDRARAVASDPRPPAPDRADLVHLIRRLVDDVDRLSGEAAVHITLAGEAHSVSEALRQSWAAQARDLDRLTLAVGRILTLHERAADGTCGSCRVMHPCLTVRAAAGERP